MNIDRLNQFSKKLKKKTPVIINDISITSTKWLDFRESEYKLKDNQNSKWSYIERKGKTNVVTIICKAKNSNQYLLIAQPRIPIKKVIVEFPAGLVDKGESATIAALRELKEETGYKFDPITISQLAPKSAGLTNESTFIVYGLVDKKKINKAQMEKTEDIVYFWVTVKKFFKLLSYFEKSNILISNDVYTFFFSKLKIK